MGATRDHVEDSTPGSGVDRRRLLKGAVAAGVGVAAWGTPSISSLGGTPVYAAVCTQPVNVFGVNVRNTDCGGCPTTIRYKDFSTSQCTISNPFPFATSLKDNSACNVNPKPAGSCPPNAHVSVAGTPAGQTCKVRVTVQQNNCAGTAILVAFSTSFSGVSCVQLPSQTSGGVALDCSNTPTGSNFTKIDIVCSIDPDCLPS